jgi:radical SAM superfamily enzyme YgiQ (UPF0313 family)
MLAMSGIRAHDPELLALGLTLPGFVERSQQVAALPSLGLLYLAAVTPEGHELAYHEAPAPEEVPEAVLDCDLVAISTFSAQAFEAYRVADRLRARGVRVAIGGLHATARPEEAREHADWVCVGEGERVWPRIVRAAERGEPGGILRASDEGPIDVATLPVPRYDLLATRGSPTGRPYNRFTVQTSRGCPWRCDFCASTVMLSSRYRRRPVAGVLRDVRALLELHPGAFLEFADDNTFVDKAWSKQLLRGLAPLGLRWFAETDVSVADDPELLDLLAESGCRQLLIGLESPRAPALAGVELRADFKARRARDYRRAIAAIQSRGITLNACFVLGLDQHGPEIFGEVERFAREQGLYEVQITALTAFPGTPLLERLEREGRVLQPGRWDLCTLFDVNYRPRGMSPDELREGLRSLSASLYSAEGVRARRRVFFERLRRRVRSDAEPAGLTRSGSGSAPRCAPRAPARAAPPRR